MIRILDYVLYKLGIAVTFAAELPAAKPIVGNQALRAKLQVAFASVAHGQTCVVSLVGKAGTGKTLAVHELARSNSCNIITLQVYQTGHVWGVPLLLRLLCMVFEAKIVVYDNFDFMKQRRGAGDDAGRFVYDFSPNAFVPGVLTVLVSNIAAIDGFSQDVQSLLVTRLQTTALLAEADILDLLQALTADRLWSVSTRARLAVVAKQLTSASPADIVALVREAQRDADARSNGILQPDMILELARAHRFQPA